VDGAERVTPFDPTLLRRTPAVLRALFAAIPPEWSDANEGEGTFSPREVLAHLIETERRAWIPRARAILERGTAAAFERFDRFGHRSSGFEEKDPSELIDELEALRSDSLRALADLGPLDDLLGTRGTHPDLGEVTLGQLLSTWIVHDLTHVRQICRLAAKQLEDDVGPWREYLTILREGGSRTG